MTQALCKLLGNQLVQNGQKVFLQQLPSQTTLSLYFTDKSAESKEFNGKLVEFYKEMKKTQRNFEIVLIPLDESSRLTVSRWCHGLFMTIDGDNARIKEIFLIRKYMVDECCTVILIDGCSGNVINFKGKYNILQDPKGIDFPFKQRPFSQILSSRPLITINNQQTNGSTSLSSASLSSSSSSSSLTLASLPSPSPSQFPVSVSASTTNPNKNPNSTLTPNSSTTSTLDSSVPCSRKDVSPNFLLPSPSTSTSVPTTTSMTIDKTLAQPHQIKSDFKGLLFSAYWCPPCRAFVSTLTQVYHRLRRQGKSIQIIFVSSDRSEESFDRFFSIMPWLAIPYQDARRQELTDYFNVKAIPSLIIIQEEGGDGGVEKIITREGRLEINEDLEALEFPWYPKLVNELKDRHSNILNHFLSVIYLLGDDDEYEKAQELLHPIALEISESDMEEALQPNFFIGTDSELTESLRLFIDLDESSAYIVILDLPHMKYYTITATQIRQDQDIREYIKRFQSGQVPCRYIEGHGCL